MRKTLTLTLAVALFAILAAVVVAQVGQDRAPGGTAATTETTEGTTTEETTPETTTTTEDNPERVRTDIAEGDDISGPCDEAEHANDPRCTGVAAGEHRGRDEDHGEDNSGPGSVNPGHDDVDDDSSGSGHGGDDGVDDDSSGSGHGGGGSSGHGGGDSD